MAEVKAAAEEWGRSRASKLWVGGDGSAQVV
jgi:hypothetical protein